MKSEAEITKALLLEIIKLCEDYQKGDIEGQGIEPWMEHIDKAIAAICETASEALLCMSESQSIHVERKRAAQAGSCSVCNESRLAVVEITLGDRSGSQTIRLCFACWNNLVRIGEKVWYGGGQ